MKKNYYQILGISPDESEEGIRSAYRRKAKLYHPDRAGTGGKSRFQDLAEAYDILSHPEKKRSYDRELAMTRQASVLEPIFPKRAAGPGFPFSSHRSRKSLFQELFEEVCSGYGMNGFPSGLDEALEVKVVLSEEEAEQGCVLSFGLDVPGSCPVCSGAGPAYVLLCRSCGGTGQVSERVHLRVRVPNRVEHGSVLEIPFNFYGFDRLLRLSVHVTPTS